MTWALNHMAYFLLTNLLLEELKAAAPSRVIRVASDARAWPKGIDFDDVQGRNRYGGLGPTPNPSWPTSSSPSSWRGGWRGPASRPCAAPGFRRHQFLLERRHERPAGRTDALGARLVAINAERGAATTIYLATSPEVGGVTGRYFEKQRPVTPSRAGVRSGRPLDASGRSASNWPDFRPMREPEPSGSTRPDPTDSLAGEFHRRGGEGRWAGRPTCRHPTWSVPNLRPSTSIKADQLSL